MGGRAGFEDVLALVYGEVYGEMYRVVNCWGSLEIWMLLG